MTDHTSLFETLERISQRPEVYSRYTTDALWSSPDISEMMLRYHLDGEVDLASRRTEFIETSLDWITSKFELGPDKRVIDLGCGPGLYANRLARTGARVTGVDISPRSIEYARERAERDGLDIDYRLGDYLALDIETGYDLATMIMCDYCAMSPTQRARLLERVGRLLAPGGSFLFDVYSVAYYETWEEMAAYGAGMMDGFWSSQPYYGFQNTFKYDDDKVVLEKYEIVERERSTEYFNWFQHYSVESLTAEVERAGLTVDEVYGDVAGEPFEAIAARVRGGGPQAAWLADRARAPSATDGTQRARPGDEGPAGEGDHDEPEVERLEISPPGPQEDGHRQDGQPGEDGRDEVKTLQPGPRVGRQRAVGEDGQGNVGPEADEDGRGVGRECDVEDPAHGRVAAIPADQDAASAQRW